MKESVKYKEFPMYRLRKYIHVLQKKKLNSHKLHNNEPDQAILQIQ